MRKDQTTEIFIAFDLRVASLGALHCSQFFRCCRCWPACSHELGSMRAILPHPRTRDHDKSRHYAPARDDVTTASHFVAHGPTALTTSMRTSQHQRATTTNHKKPEKGRREKNMKTNVEIADAECQWQ